MQWRINAVWLLFLWTIGVVDGRNLSVSKRSLIFGGVLTLISICVEQSSVSYVLSGGILGCVFILVSKYTKEALGYGDSMMITLVSMKYGAYMTIYILGGAFAMGAIYGSLKLGRGGEVPFLPFLAMSVTLCMLL